MKKLNLTLAVLLALGLTACGSSSSDGGKSNDVVDNNTNQNDGKDKLPAVPSSEVVDPTNEDIVAQFDLEKESSTGSNLYIRGEKSSFQKKTNPEYNSQSSVTYHNTLEGNLRNLFIVQSKDKNKDGKRVVYYAGQVGKTGTQLQERNLAEEILPVLSGHYYNSKDGYDIASGADSVLDKIKEVTGGGATDLEAYLTKYNDLIGKKNALDEKLKSGTAAEVKTAAGDYNNAVYELVKLGEDTSLAPVKATADDKKVDISYSEADLPKYVDEYGKELATYVPGTTSLEGPGIVSEDPATRKQLVLSPESYREFALKHRIRFQSFVAMRDSGKKLINKTEEDVGLVHISTPDGADTEIKGREEDKERVQQTRIFGHKYLDTAGSYEMNSYSGAVLTEDSKDILAVPQKLEHVQYGRVTADTETEGVLAKVPSERFVYKVLGFANKGASDAVDFYFARGEGATKVENMPKEGKLNYLGHAITWGFAHMPAGEDHGAPNSVGTSAVVDGLGSFVKATLDASTKTFSGSIYDAYAFRKDGKYGELQEHELINFKDAKVKGNTAFGEATAKGYEDKGELRASFFGPSAQEVAGVVNSVTAKDKRANAKWGAVFGAKQPAKTPDSNVIWGSDKD